MKKFLLLLSIIGFNLFYAAEQKISNEKKVNIIAGMLDLIGEQDGVKVCIDLMRFYTLSGPMGREVLQQNDATLEATHADFCKKLANSGYNLPKKSAAILLHFGLINANGDVHEFFRKRLIVRARDFYNTDLCSALSAEVSSLRGHTSYDLAKFIWVVETLEDNARLELYNKFENVAYNLDDELVEFFTSEDLFDENRYFSEKLLAQLNQYFQNAQRKIFEVEEQKEPGAK